MFANFSLYVIKTLKLVIVFTLSIILVRAFIIEPGKVNGRSMEPTYYDNDFFLINKFILLFRPPARGEIVQFYDDESGKYIIKRIIGLPGEKIYIKQNKVFIINPQGQEWELPEPYLAANVITRSPTGEAKIYGPIPEHAYFMLGDNRELSIDSRVYGPIDRSYINGLVIVTKKHQYPLKK